MEMLFEFLEIWFAAAAHAVVVLSVGMTLTVLIVAAADSRRPRRAWLAKRTSEAAHRWASHSHPRAPERWSTATGGTQTSTPSHGGE